MLISSIEQKNLTILDRWILAKMHLFIKNGKDYLDSYNVSDLVKSFEVFLEELSNWYIRRNRRRFWKSEDDQDKFTAYATLYHVLVNTIKCMAPVLPFCTEMIYSNLVSNMDPEAPESVHLCNYPNYDEGWINEKIIKQVDALKQMVELGRSARNISKQKIPPDASDRRANGLGRFSLNPIGKTNVFVISLYLFAPKF